MFETYVVYIDRSGCQSSAVLGTHIPDAQAILGTRKEWVDLPTPAPSTAPVPVPA